MTIRYADKSERQNWDKIALHPLQSWAWGEFRQKMGLDVARLVNCQGNKLIDDWQLTFHRIPFLPLTIGYFPKGPLPTVEMIQELTKIGRRKNAIFIQFEPNIQQISNFQFQISNFVPSHHPLFTKYTFTLNLTSSEDDLLKKMHPKTRYNIRLAQKHGVIIKEDNSDLAFNAYLKLSQETTSRQGFFAHNKTYQREMWKTMSQNKIAHLFTATYKGEVLAAWIIFAWKDTIYYPYGASSRRSRETMAPNLMLWEIARWAKAKNFKYFDLWGALGPNPLPTDPWYGFHRFKEGYTPQLVEFIGSFDLVINPVLYQLYILIDRLRWFCLKLYPKT